MSIREENGANTETVVALGKVIAAGLEDHDTTGHWMAYHLAALVQAAEDDAATTIDQRQTIISTILQIWDRRYEFVRRTPLQDFAHVFAALDRLGDETPWRYSRFPDEVAETLDPADPKLPLVSVAARLERLSRETLILLIWRAARDAADEGAGWLEIADKLEPSMESRVLAKLRDLRLQRRASRVASTASDEVADESVQDAVSSSEDGGVPVDRKLALDSARRVDSDRFDGDQDNDESVGREQLHARKLREMARLLSDLADTLDGAERR